MFLSESFSAVLPCVLAICLLEEGGADVLFIRLAVHVGRHGEDVVAVKPVVGGPRPFFAQAWRLRGAGRDEKGTVHLPFHKRQMNRPFKYSMCH